MADMDRLLRIPLGKGPARAKARRSSVALPPPDRYDPDDDSDDDRYADDDDDAGLEYGSDSESDRGDEDVPDDGPGPTPEQVDCARDALDALQSGDARKFAEAVLAIAGR